MRRPGSYRLTGNQGVFNALGWAIFIAAGLGLIAGAQKPTFEISKGIVVALIALAGVLLILYRFRADAEERQLRISHGILPLLKVRSIPSSSVSELLLQGSYYRGTYYFHLSWIDVQGRRGRLSIANEKQREALEDAASEMAAKLAVHLRKVETYQSAALKSVATLPQRSRAGVVCLTVGGGLLLVGLLFRLSVATQLWPIAQLYERSVEKSTVGDLIEACAWAGGVAFLIIGLCILGHYRSVKRDLDR